MQWAFLISLCFNIALATALGVAWRQQYLDNRDYLQRR